LLVGNLDYRGSGVKKNVKPYPENLGHGTLQKENEKLVKNEIEEEEVKTTLLTT
jgi:hypothetical protein